MPRRGEPLATYRAKRDFKRTREPSGKAAVSAGRRLVVQRHFARREHFDLRLEIDGVLASWAVTRGPSANPRDKRLAVRTEDHPLDYGAFEGTIPPKNYGAGTVLLWESTTYEPLNGDPAKALQNGEIKFLAQGERMAGEWVLVRLKDEGTHENWLLIKHRDAFAEQDDSLARRFETSVVSARDRADVEAGRAPQKVKGKAEPPAFRPPNLCESAKSVPTDKGWLYELKYDGYRLQIAMGGGAARVYTRSGLDWSPRFPGLVAAARRLPCTSALLDGEAVVFDDKGVSDFPALVAALESGRSENIVFVAFDLLERDRKDCTKLPLVKRKTLLRDLLPDGGRLRFGDFFDARGAEMFKLAVAAGAEGVVAKRADSPYRSGRSSDWLKIKAHTSEDVVILGHTPSEKGENFAALLAARRAGNGWIYLGKIGTGFKFFRSQIDAKIAQAPAARPKNLANADKLPKRAVFWQKPVEAEVGLGGWTGDGFLRQARLLRLRDDLPSPAPRMTKSRLTHPDKIMFPDCGVTKGEVAAYYAAVAERMAPHLAQRAVSLVRAPDGIAGQKFFQRHPLKGMTAGIVPVHDPTADETYFALDGAEGLATAAQFSAIEIHGRMCRADAWDRPDRIVFDLDPDEALDFAAVRDAGLLIRDVLEAAGLKSWPLLSGGKGAHVVAPLNGSNSQEEAQDFAEAVAKNLAREKPQTFVATMMKTRRKGKIFIDWMRNTRTATAILPWSLRARPGAPVAMPLSWREFARAKTANAFTIGAAAKRQDSWADFFDVWQGIRPEVLELLRQPMPEAR